MNSVRFAVAGVTFEICSNTVDLKLPEEFNLFDLTTVGDESLPTVSNLIHIDVVSSAARAPAEKLLWLSNDPAWQVGRDNSGHFLFHIPGPSRARWLYIDESFSWGTLTGDFSGLPGPVYPFHTFDIITFSNWLANRGELLLHASGFCWNDLGYAFIGPSGVGKSTLVANLLGRAGLTVLAEDQLAVRFLDGKYWIYGTPWHLNPGMYTNQGVPLEKAFFLQRLSESALNPIGSQEAFKKLLLMGFIPYYRKETLESVMNGLQSLTQSIHFFDLAYQLGDDILNQVLNA